MMEPELQPINAHTNLNYTLSLVRKIYAICLLEKRLLWKLMTWKH